MDSFGPQDPSESLVVPHEAVAGQVVPKQRDFLSFLSLFVSVIREMSTDLHLAGVLLGPAINIQDPISRGKFSYVTLSEQEELANNMLVSPENLQRLPNIVALKSAILDGDENSPSSLRLYSSMATELQILRDRDLFRNENIVTLLGVCWQLDHLGQVLPVFIMEATEIGNLKAFLSSRSPSLEQKVKICIDIVMAIRIIHQKGVIHGDVKPENVLIFQKDDGSFIAKLCDFGSSILISAASSLCSLPGGTRIWQAPEVGDAAGPEELKLADIYSVGLVIWYIFTPNVAMAILDCDPILLQESKVSGDLIATTIDTLEDQSEQPQHIDDEEITQLQQCLVSSMLASPAAERWSNNAALECLREILNTICDRNTLLTPIHSEAECWDAISERNYTISMHSKIRSLSL
jgi:serine/threonine protein kinase